ncbi:MAG: AAA family ATPase [Nanohaloarchaea archaeon]|nr:AAA family ATPase [Candidatus Nanohaloarchaea archaeon]
MSDMIIGITGLARAGKDTAAEYIADRYNFKVFTMSDTLKGECMRRNLEITKDNLSHIGDAMRKEFGNDIVAVKTIEKAKNFPRSIITGVRSPEETDLFRQKSSHFVLLSVTSEKDTRFKRRSERDPQTETVFFARDERDMENKGLGDVLEMTDYDIENNGDFDELHTKIDTFLKTIDI